MTERALLLGRARAVLPGGVNSPVRAFQAVGGDPFFVREAHGAYLTTTDGETLIDYVMSWGPLLLGHDAPEVRDALERALARGTSFGMTSPVEIELAELVVALVPSVEMVRFVNSGTEATMAAVRVARAATGRRLLVKFEGGYHGHGDSFLVAAGSGVATLGLPDSPGVPGEVAQLTVTAPFNDISAVAAIFDRYGDDVAGVIVEPFLGNAGFIPPVSGFLEALRDLTSRRGALLIFDEVMTGFRVHVGGAQALTGVMPDLTTLGKVLGGGLPVGAFGGRRDLMELLAPAGPVYQAGTLSGNPLAMAAGLATLRTVQDGKVYDSLGRRAAKLVAGLKDAASAAGVPFTGSHAGGMWGFFFHPGPVTNFAQARQVDVDLFARFHRASRERGVYLAPSPFEAAFVSTAHADEIIGETLDRLAEALAQVARG
ncbi:MAG: glutamate-1-semialdehyde 2,1-aminomutase [Gemmatimonadales bacterium]|nr:glutamate-1-semialdehyde 2,1-aminomutase [Gemmatimonadales bacterium]NIN12306.1 glutamate-1-semialdehyde 2,1-aminomutase [Gemmatimonadales bacterium]NIN48844.1 glutamate-1-semialdehyde 2,1-aminomutase [Gemmatimonadales bacterium]NIP06308.1 glutamate-1-semialdehyde 2,1-aminomutase [Gemmatimonadales bacterium]NIR00680.1 glutamate-1-semialdehyde 2,1-aminomutase [Gemmatimonadales bacterium]